MVDCECIETCPFFNDKIEDRFGLSAIYKREYCQGNNFSCARHMVKVAFGMEKIPFNLYPNQVETAKKIIKENK